MFSSYESFYGSIFCFSRLKTAHFNGEAWRETSDGLKKTFSIQIVPKNLSTPVAPAHQMINSSLVLNSPLARHRQVLMQTSNLCQ
jgi:hypothetical protein